MIKSYSDYKEYLKEDKKAINQEHCKLHHYITDPILHFICLLRYYEYRNNCCTRKYQVIVNKLVKFFYKRLGYKLGFSIPINVFGKGLSIAHVGTIVVSNKAIIGDHCRIHACTNIGLSYGNEGPRIGNNVYIAPGVKIFGPITIADDIAIGANAVVNKSFTTPGVTLGGGTG